MDDIAKKPDFDIEAFNPKKAELAELVKKYEGLTVSGIDDKDGLERVSKARKELAAKRCDIQNKLKEARDPAIAFQKAVIALENELVGIIEPTEKKLKAEEDKVEAEKRRILEEEAAKNRAILNARVAELAKVGASADLETLKVMDEEQFEMLLAEKSVEFQEAKAKREAEEKKLAEEREAMAKERAELERLRRETVKREAEENREAVEMLSGEKACGKPANTRLVLEDLERDPVMDELVAATEKEANKRRMLSLAEFVHKAAVQFGNQETYELLVRLAGTVGKLYDEEEQADALKEECLEWAKDPTCFSE